MKNKNYFVVLLLIILSFSSFAQRKESKWVVGFGIASAYYYAQDDAQSIGNTFILQPARLNVAGYFFNNFIIDIAFATAIGDNQKYTNFDGTLRFNFLGSNDKRVPYLLVGGSFIDAAQLTPTINVGAGYTHWLLKNLGVNGQLMYRSSEEKYTSQKSHLYASVSLVYDFKYRSSKRFFCE